MKHQLTLFLALACAFPGFARGQAMFLDQPQDMTITSGQPVFFALSVTTAFTRVDQAYRGVHPDTSDPLHDDALLNVGQVIQFKPGQVFQTTSYWLRICDDFGCSDSNTFTITVEGEDIDPTTAAFGETTDLGEMWVRSDWLGDFNISFFPWIFHAQHLWMFAFDESTPDNIFLFDLASAGWFYTSSTLYPNLFAFDRNSWVFYFAGTSGPRDFVDLQTQEFFTIP